VVRPDETAGVAVPNALSLARLPLAALFWIAPAHPPFAFTILGLAGLTDVLDGWLVRRWRRRRWRASDPGAFAAGTGRGAWLDGLCDKIFVLSVLAAVAWAIGPPLYLLALVASREILMAPLAVGYRLLPEGWRSEYDLSAGWPGKLATTLQFTAIALAVLQSPWFPPAAWLTGAAGILAVAYYLRRALRTAPRRRS
jgi:cardiolipin synthase (CMP-forming)